MYTVAQLKDSISGQLSGLNLGNVTNLDGAIARSARTLIQKADVMEANGKQVYTLYDHVFDYLAPSTIFGGVVYDFRPQSTDRNESDYVYKENIEPFDRTKLYIPNGVQLTFEYNKGVGLVRVGSARTTSRAVLDPMTATTGWTAAGSASGLTADSTDYYEAPDSLRILLTGNSTGTLTKTIAAGDLTTYQGVGVVFLAIKIPSTASAATLLTSIDIRLGSSASAYTTVTTATGFLGSWTLGEWLLVALDLSTGSDTGTPNYTDITYLQVRLTHSATITNFRVGGIWAALPTPYNLIYGSAAIFMASGSDPSLSITTDSDQILLNDAAYTLFETECAKTIAKQQAGGKSTLLVQGLDKDLNELYSGYKADNPSQEIRVTSNYYE